MHWPRSFWIEFLPLNKWLSVASTIGFWGEIFSLEIKGKYYFALPTIDKGFMQFPIISQVTWDSNREKNVCFSNSYMFLNSTYKKSVKAIEHLLKLTAWWEQISIVTICDSLATQRSKPLSTSTSILFLNLENNVFVWSHPHTLVAGDSARPCQLCYHLQMRLSVRLSQIFTSFTSDNTAALNVTTSPCC